MFISANFIQRIDIPKGQNTNKAKVQDSEVE